MNFFIGTSGYSYPEWKGSFYPEKTPAKQFLNYYASRFQTVEINSTFRTLPATSVLEAWAEQVPSHFRFAIKAPQGITHFRRLKDVGEEVSLLIEVAGALKKRLSKASEVEENCLLSSDGRLLASGSGKGGRRAMGDINLWSIETGKRVGRISAADAQKDSFTAVAFSMDSSKLATVTESSECRVWPVTAAVPNV